MQYYEIAHVLGIHLWDIPAAVAMLLLVVVVIGHHHNQKKRDKKFEKDLNEKIQNIRESEQGTEEESV